METDRKGGGNSGGGASEERPARRRAASVGRGSKRSARLKKTASANVGGRSNGGGASIADDGSLVAVTDVRRAKRQTTLKFTVAKRTPSRVPETVQVAPSSPSSPTSCASEPETQNVQEGNAGVDQSNEVEVLDISGDNDWQEPAQTSTGMALSVSIDCARLDEAGGSGCGGDVDQQMHRNKRPRRDSPGGLNGVLNASGAAHAVTVAEELHWACRRCTFVNHGALPACEMCSGGRHV
eukprot:COSAG05_NODE_1101_length_5877_cov_9.449983_2_plen_238_part_00